VTEQHPQLTPTDGEFIARLFRCGRCYITVADETGAPLHELLDWAAQPHIQRAIDLLAQAQLEGHRAAAIDVLRETFRKSQDPVERRRAACAIIRAILARPTRLQPSRSQDPRHTPPATPPSPAGPRRATPEEDRQAAPRATPPAPHTPAADEHTGSELELHPDPQPALQFAVQPEPHSTPHPAAHPDHHRPAHQAGSTARRHANGGAARFAAEAAEAHHPFASLTGPMNPALQRNLLGQIGAASRLIAGAGATRAPPVA
jgi:hypothetical protein